MSLRKQLHSYRYWTLNISYFLQGTSENPKLVDVRGKIVVRAVQRPGWQPEKPRRDGKTGRTFPAPIALSVYAPSHLREPTSWPMNGWARITKLVWEF